MKDAGDSSLHLLTLQFMNWLPAMDWLCTLGSVCMQVGSFRKGLQSLPRAIAAKHAENIRCARVHAVC